MKLSVTCAAIATLSEHETQGEDPPTPERNAASTETETIETGISDSNDNCRIAIIGMAGRFPGSSNTEKFWEMLEQGLDSRFAHSPLLQHAAGTVGPVATPSRRLFMMPDGFSAPSCASSHVGSPVSYHGLEYAQLSGYLAHRFEKINDHVGTDELPSWERVNQQHPSGHWLSDKTEPIITLRAPGGGKTHLARTHVFAPSRPGKCPIALCDITRKGFARKYDKDRVLSYKLSPIDSKDHLGAINSVRGHDGPSTGGAAAIQVGKALVRLKQNAIPPQMHAIFGSLSSQTVQGHGRRRVSINNFSSAGGNAALLLEDTPTPGRVSPSVSHFELQTKRSYREEDVTLDMGVLHHFGCFEKEQSLSLESEHMLNGGPCTFLGLLTLAGLFFNVFVGLGFWLLSEMETGIPRSWITADRGPVVDRQTHLHRLAKCLLQRKLAQLTGYVSRQLRVGAGQSSIGL